jgi:hypothetical protein
MRLDKKIMYVGRAIEQRENQSTFGLRKRLQEHWRGADNCKIELFQNRSKLFTSITLCSSMEEAINLESQLIRKYDTVNNGWNLRYED